MHATNLASLFIPHVFNLNMMRIIVKENTILSSMFSPKRLRKQMDRPPEQTKTDLEEHRTAINICAEMIIKYKELFYVIDLYFIFF